jgi:hypothetical protein
VRTKFPPDDEDEYGEGQSGRSRKKSSDFSIDREKLAEHITDYPRMIEKCAAALTAARSDTLKFEDRLKQRKLTLATEMRASPGEFGLAKSTEAAISEAVETHHEVRKLAKMLMEAKHVEGEAFGDMDAARAHGQSLELLAKIHGTLWFSNASLSGSDSSPRSRRMKDID